MNKKVKIALIAVASLVVLALIAVVLVIVTKNMPPVAEEPSPENNPTALSTSSGLPPEPTGTAVPTDDQKEYVGQESDPGLCKSMQTLVQKKVIPLLQNAPYGKLDKRTKEIAKEGNAIIAQSQEKDEKKVKNMKDLMTNMVRYGKYGGDVNASQSQVIATAVDFQSSVTLVKRSCNWK